MNLYETVERYRKEGFSELKTDSGTGSYIFMSVAGDRVVKINQDSAYDKFVHFAMLRPLPAFPRIIRHERPLGDFRPLSNAEYTVTELEVLVRLSNDEQRAILTWIEKTCAFLRGGGRLSTLPHDPYDLKVGFEMLQSEAARVGVSLDVLKGSNFMKRVNGLTEQFVYVDPFN